MKRYFLSACLLFLGSSALFGMSERVIRGETFDFLINLYTHYENNNHNFDGFNFSVLNRDIIASDLDMANNAELNKDTMMDLTNRWQNNQLFIHENDRRVFHPRVGLWGRTIKCEVYNNKEEYITSQATAGPKSNSKDISKKPDTKSAPFNFLKAGLAGTVTGVITYAVAYYAIGLYNKGKEKAQQYSQKKWALGSAAVVGVSTFAYLQYMASPSAEQ